MAKKGDIIIVGGKKIVSDGKGGGRVVRKSDKARARIKRDTASGKAPPIPKVTLRGAPRTQRELNKSRKRVKRSTVGDKIARRNRELDDLIKQTKGK